MKNRPTYDTMFEISLLNAFILLVLLISSTYSFTEEEFNIEFCKNAIFIHSDRVTYRSNNIGKQSVFNVAR